MSRFWLSYDLGFQADYRKLYSWLDEVGSQECGDAVATFESKSTREKVAGELVKLVEPGDRLYLIGKRKDGRVVGGFVTGRRKVPPPWAGLGSSATEAVDEE